MNATLVGGCVCSASLHQTLKGNDVQFSEGEFQLLCVQVS